MQEKNDSFFDLEFQRKINWVPFAVAGPEGGAGLHGEPDGLVFVKASGTGITAGDEFDKALGAPQPSQGSAAVLHVDLAEAHAVDIDHSEVIASVVFIPQDVSR